MLCRPSWILAFGRTYSNHETRPPLFSHWQNVLGFLLVLFFVTVALWLRRFRRMILMTPGPFKKVGHTRLDMIKPEPHPPSDIALLGTLPQQYDVFHTLVWGTRDALSFGLLVVLISGAFGVIFGAVAGTQAEASTA